MPQSYPLIPTLTPARGTPVDSPLLSLAKRAPPDARPLSGFGTGSDPSAVPKGEGLCFPLLPGEGQRVREQSGIIKIELELVAFLSRN